MRHSWRTCDCRRGGTMPEPWERRPEQAATELREETGYTSSLWYELATLSPSPHRIEKVETVFLARDANPDHEPSLDDTEDVRIAVMPLDEAVTLLSSSPLASAVCIA